MRSRLLFVAGALLALAPLPARAASVDIEARQNEFVPRGVGAAAGDEVTWHVTSGTHTIAAYQGGTFDSGPTPLAPGQSFGITFAGGTARYRCTIHSTLDASDVCAGMCGVLSSTPPTMTPPTITLPVSGSTINSPSVTISGTAPANAAQVRIREGSATLAFVEPSGGSWSRALTFGNGPHTITATSIHAEGYESAQSAGVTFTVQIPDTKAPVVQISGPSAPLESNPMKISGLATDDVVVQSISILVRDLLGRTVSPPNVTCTGCGTPSAKFNASLPVLPGPYTVIVRADDAASHTGEGQRNVIML